MIRLIEQVPVMDKKEVVDIADRVFDGRNQYNPKEMKRMGFEYFSIGRLG